MDSQTKRSLFRLWRVFGSAVVVAMAALCTIWLNRHWSDQDLQQQVFNFGAAWLPFVLSVIVAFIPSRESQRKAHMAWRGCLVVAGLITSIVMWHQQALAISSARKDQEQVVMTAVNKANEHTDRAVESANTHTDTEITMVRDDLKNATIHADEQNAALTNNVGTLANLITKTGTDLTASIDKVGKPDPPEQVKIIFSLSPDKGDFPVLLGTRVRDADGSIPVGFTSKNVSHTQATGLELWVSVCNSCSFASEPDGFEKPVGIPENTRHRLFGSLNQGVTIAMTTLHVKAPETASFEVGFTYTCKECAPPTEIEQKVTIIVLPRVGN